MSHYKDTKGYKIHLNFLAINPDLPNFRVYRLKRDGVTDGIRRTGTKSYRLPAYRRDEEDWVSYWVSMEPRDQMEEFCVTPRMNPYLTCEMLFWSLKKAARANLTDEQYRLFTGFTKEISFIHHTHQEGNEELVVRPYYLRCKRQFGYIVDFHFRLREGETFSRKVQQLSLSLDKGYRRNLDYVSDRIRKIRDLIRRTDRVFCALQTPDSASQIRLTQGFIELPADRLRTKVYRFSGERESKSQFIGLQRYGPLTPLSRPLRLLFVFREEDRLEARRLAINLRKPNSRDRYSFPGFSYLFKQDLVIDREPVILPNLDRSSIETALARVKTADKKAGAVVPVVVLPENDESYLVQKSLFAHNKIATQVCTLPVLRDDRQLKWAIANIALQIFCKAGGVPWKVRPTSGRSLIIGISQSHKFLKICERRSVEKYFSFSIMSDNSGIFQRIRVLGDDDDQRSYISALKSNLREVLEQGTKEFDRVVVHTSFKLKYAEMDAIEQTVRNIAENSEDSCRFAVVKVNHKSDFFGGNSRTNSLVPYEATRVRLGPREYLVWFDGIFPDKTTVRKIFSGPVHLQILRISEENKIPDEVLLQDLVNLSGANWRGFNAKSTPVSVFYCHLVARMVHDFHERGLPMPSVEDIRPWFL